MTLSWEALQEMLAGHHATCVAVSKKQTIKRMQHLYDLGQRHFGENHCQEALQKMAQWSHQPDVVWHFIGRIQSNKCKHLARHFDWVQTVQSQQVIALLAKHRALDLPPLNVLLQVTTDDVAHEYAIPLGRIDTLMHAIDGCPNLRLRGWMAMPPSTVKGIARKHFFVAVAQAFEAQRAQNHWDTLSMGMSGDHQAALTVGANMVRLGKMLFGESA